MEPVSTTFLVINLIITISIILLLILKFKQNPVIAMFVGALYMGIGSSLGLPETINSIVGGFGGTMQGIGISVGFGIILGQLVADTGGVQSIANGIIKFFGKKRSSSAMGLTGFIVSVPVFYDVGFVILTPIAKALAKQSNKSIAFYISALVAGLGIAHTFIPPTPGPLAGADILGIDVGTMIIWGIILGLPSFIIATFIYNKVFLSREGFWNEDCLDSSMQDLSEVKELEDEHIKDESRLPSFGLAMLPIALPILMILIGTVTAALIGKDAVVSPIIVFMSDKNIAMFVGVLTAMLITIGRLDSKAVSKSVDKALSQAGVVLLITGMGGGLGRVLGDVGIGTALLEVIETVNIHPILFAWLVAAILKAAQGSGTIAMITTVGLLAPTVGSIGIAPVVLALSVFSGTLATAHVNDSAFWITSKIAGLSTIGGLKAYTLTCSLVSVVSLAGCFILNIFL